MGLQVSMPAQIRAANRLLEKADKLDNRFVGFKLLTSSSLQKTISTQYKNY
jgi:hypothetical protein